MTQNGIKKRFNPKTETCAFRIWAFCQPLGWDCTVAQIASALDEDLARIRGIIIAKRWQHRVRRTKRDNSNRMRSFRAALSLEDVRDVMAG